MYNKVTIIGRLTRDPVLRMTTTGTANVRFSLAVDRITRKGEEQKTDFLRCVAWGVLGQRCNDFLSKGRLVAIEGRLQLSSYEKNGETMPSAEIVADNFQLLDRKPTSGYQDNNNSYQNNQKKTEEEVPF